jgi:hypothetical protein
MFVAPRHVWCSLVALVFADALLMIPLTKRTDRTRSLRRGWSDIKRILVGFCMRFMNERPQFKLRSFILFIGVADG